MSPLPLLSRQSLLRLGATALLAALSTSHVFAADGDPDTSFSSDGIAYANWVANLRSDLPMAVASRSDGAVYVGGTAITGTDDPDWAVARLLPNGAMDTSFGAQGLRTVGMDYVTDGYDSLSSVHPLSDGKVMLLGRAQVPDEIVAQAPAAMARLTAAGNLDTSFADNGKRVFDTPPWPVPIVYFGGDSTRQPDGKFVFVGHCLSCGSSIYSAMVLRVDENGLPDNTFGLEGWAAIPTRSSDTRFQSIAVDGQGRIVVGGTTVDGSSKRAILARFLPNGQPDPGFGGGSGWVMITSLPLNTPYGWIASAIAVDRDRSLRVAVHNYSPMTVNQTGVLRVLEDGTVDATYAGSGFRDLTREDGSRILSLAQRSDGRLLAAGWIFHTGGARDFFVARLLANGNLDNSFDSNGVIRVETSPDEDGGVAMTLSGGKPLIAGYSSVTSEGVNGAVLRLQSDLIFANRGD